MADAINGCNKPRIEIKTLTQEVCKSSDEILQALMCEGWELLCDPAMSTLLTSKGVQHFEVIKLFRLIDEDDGGEEELIVGTDTTWMKPHFSAKVIIGGDVRPPQPPTSRITVLGVDAEHPLIVERKPVEDVTYAEALASLQYTAEEISEIADRENRAHLLQYVTMERQEWGGRSWDSLVNHLPPRPLSFAKCSPRVIDGVAT